MDRNFEFGDCGSWGMPQACRDKQFTTRYRLPVSSQLRVHRHLRTRDYHHSLPSSIEQDGKLDRQAQQSWSWDALQHLWGNWVRLFLSLLSQLILALALFQHHLLLPSSPTYLALSVVCFALLSLTPIEWIAKSFWRSTRNLRSSLTLPESIQLNSKRWVSSICTYLPLIPSRQFPPWGSKNTRVYRTFVQCLWYRSVALFLCLSPNFRSSGTIDFSEFMLAMTLCSSENPEDKLRFCFRSLDTDNNGTWWDLCHEIMLGSLDRSEVRYAVELIFKHNPGIENKVAEDVNTPAKVLLIFISLSSHVGRWQDFRICRYRQRWRIDGRGVDHLYAPGFEDFRLSWP